MKRIRSYNRNVFGVETMWFSIIRNKKKDLYFYYLKTPWATTENFSWKILLGKSKTKLKDLNKYSLTLMGIIFTLITPMRVAFYFYLWLLRGVIYFCILFLTIILLILSEMFNLIKKFRL